MGWIHAVIDLPADELETGADFWSASLGWPIGAAWQGHPELRSFEPTSGDPYVHLQSITGAPRIHLDLEVEDLPGARDHWVSLGAEVIGPPPGPETSWRAMSSPGGFPFCLVPRSEHRVPDPVTWPTAHRSRLVQICIDLPRDKEDRELEFWRAGLEGRWATGRTSNEFLGKVHDDDGSPIQLLFQRLDEPTGPVRAHLDLGTDRMDLEVTRQVDLGAQELLRGNGFIALDDPAGLPYCVTGNAPDSTQQRHIGDVPWT